MLPRVDSSVLLHDLLDCLPEGVLCLGILVLLLLRIFRLAERSHMGRFALLIVVIALGITVLQWMGVLGLTRYLVWLGIAVESDPGRFVLALNLRSPSAFDAQVLLGHMLLFDAITVYMRLFVLVSLVVVIWLTLLTGIPDREDSADFYCLLLGASLGMMLMTSAVHLLMVYLAIEMASLPSYALAGFLKGRRQSSEAALKYVVYGGGSAGVMLYGISLLTGHFGTGYLPDLSVALAVSLQPGPSGVVFEPAVLLGVLFVLVGIAFKLAAVPFHFWCPDVFEGASAEVAGFLSVVSKGAALALLARFCLILGGLDRLSGQPEEGGLPVYASIRHYLLGGLAGLAVVTVTFGNLAAFRQTNLKRLLAYSTIAHAGYMLMAVATLTHNGVESLLFYLVAYLFTNLAAFSLVAFIRNATGSEDLRDLRGLVRRTPALVACLAVVLLSLAGLPPLAGFAAKFQVFTALYGDGQGYFRAGEDNLGRVLITLVVVALVNTVLSAFYYVNVLKVLVLDQRVEDVEGLPTEPIREPAGQVFFSGLLVLAVIGLGIFWGPVDNNCRRCLLRFLPGTGVDRPLPPRERGGQRGPMPGPAMPQPPGGKGPAAGQAPQAEPKR